jgi:hypothetical protein
MLAQRVTRSWSSPSSSALSMVMMSRYGEDAAQGMRARKGCRCEIAGDLMRLLADAANRGMPDRDPAYTVRLGRLWLVVLAS